MVLKSPLTVFVLLFLPCHCQTAQILPPRNLSAVWKSDFDPGLSWLPPHHSTTNCSYKVISTSPREHLIIDKSPCYIENKVMEGGSIQWSISTVCQQNRSVAVVLNVSYPEIVKHLKCYLYAPNQSRCEWLPNFSPPDLKFFYISAEAFSSKNSLVSLVECSSYIYNESMKTGCEIQATENHIIYILFNGTLNNKPVRNTFLRKPKDDVRLPPLKLTATKNGNEINMNWNKPNILPKDWIFKINYTECDVLKSISVKGETAYVLESVSHCQYNISIRAQSKSGKAPWSDWKYFDAEHDSNMHSYAYATILILFGVLGRGDHSFIKCQNPRIFSQTSRTTSLTPLMGIFWRKKKKTV
ncbi:interleukin-13 receptor subunit alpha-2-like isoform X2 [Gouania willdenowi]|uniref:interleukin-13 receptor subunit alpha-2-like isoform X2 n=1 Tax=Gouania willdenowi TaxID=441366 RepID=UPI001055BAA3|nr:interleukin-13 receptor subunit alpha-2 isoform X2 [Gouania willdenowi]